MTDEEIKSLPPGWYPERHQFIKLTNGIFVTQGEIVWKNYDGSCYMVPSGSTTDFASSKFEVPILGITIDLLPVRASCSLSAVMHDYHYRGQCMRLTEIGWSTELIHRNKADSYFSSGLKMENCSPFERMRAWFGVRVFGWMFFNQKTKE